VVDGGGRLRRPRPVPLPHYSISALDFTHHFAPPLPLSSIGFLGKEGERGARTPKSLLRLLTAHDNLCILLYITFVEQFMVMKFDEDQTHGKSAIWLFSLVHGGN
jgi:hypothetical protein